MQPLPCKYLPEGWNAMTDGHHIVACGPCGQFVTVPITVERALPGTYAADRDRATGALEFKVKFWQAVGI